MSQALGFRHSHLDSGGYAFDQKHEGKDLEEAVNFLIQDEADRVFLTSMVCCLFAREIYTREVLTDCLNSLGYGVLADHINNLSGRIQRLRWKLRLASGFDPEAIPVPRRFMEVTSWKGLTDENFLNGLKAKYAERIVALGEGG